MNKVICEICGTSYPETAEQCPICGYTRDLSALLSRDDIETISEPVPAPRSAVRGSTAPAEAPGSRPARAASSQDSQPRKPAESKKQTKGGKFSQANVRKRNQDAPKSRPAKSVKPQEDEELEYQERPRESNGFLVVLLILVIVALLAVTGYIAYNYFLPYAFPEETEPQFTAEPTELLEETEPQNIPCTSLVLMSGGTVKLEEVGQNWLLNVLVLPVDSTDGLVFTSSDETVATVNSEGRITAVGEGEAVITISCGEQSMDCKVICGAGEEVTEAPEVTQAPEETEEPTEEE